MFERFTESARQVVVAAQEEARTLGHDYIGTEHILLGLLRHETSAPAEVLAELNVTLERARAQVLRVLERVEEPFAGQTPFTPRVKHVLELSLRAALAHGHNYIGTGHLVLWLLDEGEGVAALVLSELGVEADVLRSRVASRLREDAEAPDDRYLPHWQARRAVQLAAEEAFLGSRAVDPGDLIIGLAKVDDAVRDVMTRYVSLDELARAFEEARRGREEK